MMHAQLPARPRVVVYGLVTIGLVTATLAVAQVKDPLKKANPAAYARAASMKTVGEAVAPRLIAVRVHHDMCPYCKSLKPDFEKVTKQPRDESVLWVTLDLTTEQSQQQSALLSAALGVQELWTGDLTPIGTVTFVDGTTKRPSPFIAPERERGSPRRWRPRSKKRPADDRTKKRGPAPRACNFAGNDTGPR